MSKVNDLSRASHGNSELTGRDRAPRVIWRMTADSPVLFLFAEQLMMHHDNIDMTVLCSVRFNSSYGVNI
jgi:hypothetical protein